MSVGIVSCLLFFHFAFRFLFGFGFGFEIGELTIHSFLSFRFFTFNSIHIPSHPRPPTLRLGCDRVPVVCAQAETSDDGGGGDKEWDVGACDGGVVWR